MEKAGNGFSGINSSASTIYYLLISMYPFTWVI